MAQIDLWQARRLKLRDFQMLEVLAETGSMAAAAQQLGLSQPAVSKAMAEMEHSLKAQLLDRTPRGVEVTESGRVWLERGRVILDEARQGITDLERLSDPTKGEVRIGTTEPGAAIVSEIVSSLSRRHPRITFQIIVSDASSLRSELRERKVDVLIAFWIPAAGEDDLSAEILYKAVYTVAADHRHPVIRRKQLSLSELTGELWAFPPSDSLQRRLVEDLFRRSKLKLPQATVTTLSYYMMLNLLATGRFLSALPITMLQHPSHKAWLRAVPIEKVDPAGTVAAITLKKRRMGGAVKLFVDESRSVSKHMSWGK